MYVYVREGVRGGVMCMHVDVDVGRGKGRCDVHVHVARCKG